MSLSSFCVDYLLLGMEPTRKSGLFPQWDFHYHKFMESYQQSWQ